MRIKVAIATGLALTAFAVGVSLARSPQVRAGSDGTPLPGEIGATYKPATLCQGAETIPAGTTAIHISILSLLGPRLELTARSHGRVVTTGELGYGWTGSSATIPVRRVVGNHPRSEVCVSMAKRQQLVNFRGENTKFSPTTEDGRVLSGRLRLDYLREAGKSWWGLLRPTIRRMGLGVGGGGWIVLLPLMALAAAAALASWLLARDLR